MLGKVIGLSSVVSAVLLAVLFETTTPATIGPFGVLVVFILMYITVLGALSFFILSLGRIIIKISPKEGRLPITLGRAYYYASVLALGPVIVIGMHSVGEVGLYELSLVTLFLVIACIYISKRSA